MTQKLVSTVLLLFLLSQNLSQVQCLSTPTPPTPYPLTADQKSFYQKNGYLILPSLLTPTQVTNSLQAVTSLQSNRNLATKLIYKLFPTYGNLSFQTWRTNPALEDIAFDSPASDICAQLMTLDSDPDGRTMRLVKDAVLGYSPGDKGCDWHIDDKVFWPCTDTNYGQVDAGINVWITLSEIDSKIGGGLALAQGSHVENQDWIQTAREVIRKGGPTTTCQMANLDEQSWNQLEALKQVFDFQPGDAIFHNRYLFHKVDPFPTDLESEGMKHRISLRYMPSDATYEPVSDIAMENDPAVQNKGLKRGDLLSVAGEYYPQTWPCRLEEEAQMVVEADPEFISFKGIFKSIVGQMKKKKTKVTEEDS